jgi:glycosyltransferase involved in cell wall biosynthesis
MVEVFPSDGQSLKSTLLIPTLNEIQGLRALLPKIVRGWVDQILIVDGGSTDGSVDYAREMGFAVYSQKKKGLRNAFAEAMSICKGEVIITFSPDGNSIPELIPELLAEIRRGSSLAIASRYLRGARSYDDNILTAAANRVITGMVNLFYRTRLTDSMVIFRAFRKNLVADLRLDNDDTYSLEERLVGGRVGWELVMSIRCAKRSVKITEIPGNELPRVDGEKKTHYRWGVAMVVQVIKELFSRK